MAWYRVDKPSVAGSSAEFSLSARECAAAAVFKDKILVSNGNDASSRFRDLLEFSPRTLTIEKHASAQNGAQTPVSAHSFATCDGRFFYQFGGWDGSRDIASLFRYDAERRTWSSIAPVGDVIAPRHFHTCCGVGRRLVVFGGYDGARWTSDLYTFDTVTHRWSREVPVSPVNPDPRASHHAVALDARRMALFAGFDGSEFLSDLWILHIEEPEPKHESEGGHGHGDGSDAADGSGAGAAADAAQQRRAVFRWERIARPLVPTSNEAAAIQPGEAARAGAIGAPAGAAAAGAAGAAANPGSGAAPASAAVTAAAALPWAEPRSGGGMVFYRNCLIIYGGRCRRDGRVSFSDRVEAFSFDTRLWREVPTSGAVPAPRKCFAFAHAGNRLWVFGGLGTQTTYFGDIHALDLDVAVERAFGAGVGIPSPALGLGLGLGFGGMAGAGSGGSGISGSIPVPPSTFNNDLASLVHGAFKHALPLPPLTDASVTTICAANGHGLGLITGGGGATGSDAAVAWGACCPGCSGAGCTACYGNGTSAGLGLGLGQGFGAGMGSGIGAVGIGASSASGSGSGPARLAPVYDMRGAVIDGSGSGSRTVQGQQQSGGGSGAVGGAGTAEAGRLRMPSSSFDHGSASAAESSLPFDAATMPLDGAAGYGSGPTAAASSAALSLLAAFTGGQAYSAADFDHFFTAAASAAAATSASAAAAPSPPALFGREQKHGPSAGGYSGAGSRSDSPSAGRRADTAGAGAGSLAAAAALAPHGASSPPLGGGGDAPATPIDERRHRDRAASASAVGSSASAASASAGSTAQLPPLPALSRRDRPRGLARLAAVAPEAAAAFAGVFADVAGDVDDAAGSMHAHSSSSMGAAVQGERGVAAALAAAERLGADVLIEVDGALIPLHRALLAARCDFFRTMLGLGTGAQWHAQWRAQQARAVEAAAAELEERRGGAESRHHDAPGDTPLPVPQPQLQLLQLQGQQPSRWTAGGASPSHSSAAAPASPALASAAAASRELGDSVGSPLERRLADSSHSAALHGGLDRARLPLPVVPLGDVSLPAFYVLVHYLYVDALPSIWDVGELGLEVLEQAQKLGLARLSLLCQAALERFVADDTAADLLRAADQLHALALRWSCVRYILSRFDAVSAQPGFIALPPDLVREILIRRAKSLQPALAAAAAAAAASQPAPTSSGGGIHFASPRTDVAQAAAGRMGVATGGAAAAAGSASRGAPASSPLMAAQVLAAVRPTSAVPVPLSLGPAAVGQAAAMPAPVPLARLSSIPGSAPLGSSSAGWGEQGALASAAAPAVAAAAAPAPPPSLAFAGGGIGILPNGIGILPNGAGRAAAAPTVTATASGGSGVPGFPPSPGGSMASAGPQAQLQALPQPLAAAAPLAPLAGAAQAGARAAAASAAAPNNARAGGEAADDEVDGSTASAGGHAARAAAPSHPAAAATLARHHDGHGSHGREGDAHEHDDSGAGWADADGGDADSEDEYDEEDDEDDDNDGRHVDHSEEHGGASGGNPAAGDGRVPSRRSDRRLLSLSGDHD